MSDLKRRIDKHSIPITETGCWIWLGASLVSGYGSIAIKEGDKIRPRLAHRVSYQVYKGDIGANFVLHRCDVKACVNPEHLFLGTHKDNMRDMVAKGRQRKGKHGGCSPLNDCDVIAIRSAGKVSQYELAKRFSVTQSTISNIQNRKTWKHLI